MGSHQSQTRPHQHTAVTSKYEELGAYHPWAMLRATSEFAARQLLNCARVSRCADPTLSWPIKTISMCMSQRTREKISRQCWRSEHIFISRNSNVGLSGSPATSRNAGSKRSRGPGISPCRATSDSKDLSQCLCSIQARPPSRLANSDRCVFEMFNIDENVAVSGNT